MFVSRRFVAVVALAAYSAGAGIGAEPDLAGYVTLDKAITAATGRFHTSESSAEPVFLGLAFATDAKGRLTVAEVAVDSPAAKAGVKAGDVLLKIGGREVNGEDAIRDLLADKYPGDRTRLSLLRGDKPVEVTATVDALSRPIPDSRLRATLGLQVAVAKDGNGVTVAEVASGSPAARAHIKVGEVLLAVDQADLTSPESLKTALAAKRPGDAVTLTMLLAEKRVELRVSLAAEAAESSRGAGWNNRAGAYWTKAGYKVAIIGVEYPDVKHNPTITPKAWQEAMFGTGYKKTATGQLAFGSMQDYYQEQSYGHLKVEGKAFEYVEVSKKRAAYDTGPRMALLTEAMEKLMARDGKDVLKDFDGVFFIYAGERFQAARGSLYWPHRASVNFGGKRWPYFICPEGGARMGNISVFCHEFGHMLGLPDLYARPENPGMEGAGIWCAMANQAGNGRPQHFSAWCKEKLGWIKPTVVDPSVKQKLILASIEETRECLKIPVRADGSEYFLLENRRKTGFDESLPAAGLLIWRVVGGRPQLEESHGVEGPAGPRSFLSAVPFPSPANDSFTPLTTPSSRSQLGDGLSVYITNIRRLEGGRIALQIGYEYQ
ncbi:M6 family metalloprotease domain-containing protein [Fimbriiglobus ruber]|uniref:Outer membrane stress sensor protease DegQ, serine protease n=1 Tax=Fimbriiglobus ruber TaxID=1908690 RepID=A0A225D7N2_9BACT|nr:M6 family metalloprotease domain-containing protein [Fimbriiglobus ruber]OWK37462.1 Outer membrane stress sensor protease DegQ, serine protease [Fimbriiglobus ruber]